VSTSRRGSWRTSWAARRREIPRRHWQQPSGRPPSRGLQPILEGHAWAADNDGFNGHFTPEAFERHLARLGPHSDTCLFVAAPDVVRVAAATLARWPYWSAFVRDAGFPAAYIAQDGAERLGLPGDADALFLAGSDEWRERHGPALVSEALGREWHVHVGRVPLGAARAGARGPRRAQCGRHAPGLHGRRARPRRGGPLARRGRAGRARAGRVTPEDSWR